MQVLQQLHLGGPHALLVSGFNLFGQLGRWVPYGGGGGRGWGCGAPRLGIARLQLHEHGALSGNAESAAVSFERRPQGPCLDAQPVGLGLLGASLCARRRRGRCPRVRAGLLPRSPETIGSSLGSTLSESNAMMRDTKGSGQCLNIRDACMKELVALNIWGYSFSEASCVGRGTYYLKPVTP